MDGLNAREMIKFLVRLCLPLAICCILAAACHKKTEDHYLRVLPTSMHFSNDSSVQEINVQSNTDWWITGAGNEHSWFRVDTLMGCGNAKVRVRVRSNPDEEDRSGQIVFSTDESSQVVRLTQGEMSEYPDGYMLFQRPSLMGDSICIVILGEGFTGEDLTIGGTYEQIMQEAARCFFSIEPYRSLQSYFSVYALAAESREEGIGIGSASVRNKFSTYLVSENMTRLVCDYEGVRNFVRYAIPRTDSVTTCVIMVVNSTEYAGTTNVYPDGSFAIAMCPMSEQEAPNDLEGLIHHEAGGHAFGLLGDEYHFYEDTEIPNSGKQSIREAQVRGLWLNLEVTSDTAHVLWKDMLADTLRYPRVGMYEGGFSYGKGVWRSEYNSCMNDNIPYYNAWSRWLIVRRIMTLSGNKNYSFEDFVAFDQGLFPPESAASSRSLRGKVANLPLLSPPEIVE